MPPPLKHTVIRMRTFLGADFGGAKSIDSTDRARPHCCEGSIPRHPLCQDRTKHSCGRFSAGSSGGLPCILQKNCKMMCFKDNELNFLGKPCPMCRLARVEAPADVQNPPWEGVAACVSAFAHYGRILMNGVKAQLFASCKT